MKNKLTKVLLLAMISAVFFSCTKETFEIEKEQPLKENEQTGQINSNLKSASDNMINIALSKQLNCSKSVNAGASGYKAIDGDINTSWVTYPANKSDFICIDLGYKQSFDQINLYWGENNHAELFKLMISEDNQNWKSLGEDYSGNLELPGTYTARYVKVECLKKAGDVYILKEFEVLRKSLRVTASSVWKRGLGAEFAVDGNENTMWGPSPNESNPYIDIDLGEDRAFNRINIIWNETYYAKSYQIILKDTNGKLVYYNSDLVPHSKYNTFYQDVQARYIRIVCLESSVSFDPNHLSYGIKEIEICNDNSLPYQREINGYYRTDVARKVLIHDPDKKKTISFRKQDLEELTKNAHLISKIELYIEIKDDDEDHFKRKPTDFKAYKFYGSYWLRNSYTPYYYYSDELKIVIPKEDSDDVINTDYFSETYYTGETVWVGAWGTKQYRCNSGWKGTGRFNKKLRPSQVDYINVNKSFNIKMYSGDYEEVIDFYSPTSAYVTKVALRFYYN